MDRRYERQTKQDGDDPYLDHRNRTKNDKTRFFPLHKQDLEYKSPCNVKYHLNKHGYAICDEKC